MSNGQQAAMQKLLASGWKQGDPIPEWFIAADPSASVGTGPLPPGAAPLGGMPSGTMENPMELSTMAVEGQPPQAGAGTSASTGVFAGMSDEDAEKYAGMGELRKQRERAEALRDTEDAEGRYLNQGRTFVAASPLEHLSVGLRRYKGKKKSDVIGEKQTAGRKSLIDLLRDKDAVTEEDLEELGY